MKKTFTFGVVLTTILWSVGAAALVPTATYAVDKGDETLCENIVAGNLVKTHGSADIWAINDGLTRSYFANGDLFHSWNNDGSYSNHYVYVTNSCMASFSLAGAVTPRPGSYLVGEGATDYLYAVLPGNKIMKISMAAATELYGADYATERLITMDNGAWVLYDIKGFLVDGEITELVPHEGMLVKYADDYYYVAEGMVLRKVTESGLTANGMDTAWAYMLSDTTGFTMGDIVEVEETMLADVTQGMVSEVAAPGDDVAVGEGELMISLSANTPDSTTIPLDLMGAPYITILAKTGDKAVDITGLSVERAGLGASGDISKVYVEVDGVRKGSKRVLGSDDEADIYFSTDKSKITVPANSTVSIDVVVDMSGSGASGHVNYLKITALETSAADLAASLPIMGNNMAISAIAAPSITFDYDGDTAEFRVGEEGKNVAEFTLDADATEDVELSSIVLKQEGTADVDDVVNYELYYEDELVAGPVNARSDDYIVFELSDVLLLEEDETNYEFAVKADIISGNGKTVNLQLEETTDVKAVGLENNFLATPVDIDTGNSTSHDISGGALAIDEHSDNPSADTFAPKAKDVVLLVAELDADDETVVVTSMPITITKGSGTLGTDELENFTVKLDGKTVCGSLDIDSALSSVGISTSVATITCSDEFEVSGKQKLVVTVDLTSESESTYTAAIVSSGNLVAIEDLSGDALYSATTTYDVSGSATGKTMTASSGTLTVSKNTSYSNRTITTGADAYKIASFVVKAPTSQEVNVKKYTVTVGGTYGVANLTDLYISEDDDTINEPAASNDFSVSNDLSKEETLTVNVYASLDSSTTGTVTTTLVVQYKGGDDDTTTSTSAVTGQTVTIAAGSLAISRGSSNPDADLLLSGASETMVYSIEFDPSYDTYTITDLDIAMSESSAVTAVRIGDIEVTEFFSNKAEFNGLEIDVDGKTNVDVYADFAVVNSDTGIDSGVTTTFDMTAYEATALQGDDITSSTAYVTASNIFELRASKPTLVSVAGTEAATKGLLSTGDNQMVKMTVTADGGTVDFKGITLDITTSSATSSYVELLDSDLSQLATTTVALAEAGWDLSGLADSDREIGTTGVYYISVNMATVSTDGQVTVKITDITWDDDEATGDITGTYVEQLPSAKFLATQNT